MAAVSFAAEDEEDEVLEESEGCEEDAFAEGETPTRPEDEPGFDTLAEQPAIMSISAPSATKIAMHAAAILGFLMTCPFTLAFWCLMTSILHRPILYICIIKHIQDEELDSAR